MNTLNAFKVTESTPTTLAIIDSIIPLWNNPNFSGVNHIIVTVGEALLPVGKNGNTVITLSEEQKRIITRSYRQTGLSEEQENRLTVVTKAHRNGITFAYFNDDNDFVVSSVCKSFAKAAIEQVVHSGYTVYTVTQVSVLVNSKRTIKEWS